MKKTRRNFKMNKTLLCFPRPQENFTQGIDEVVGTLVISHLDPLCE